jgi:ABC-type transport system involved in multi-copper enzyme maturation permease subunit
VNGNRKFIAAIIGLLGMMVLLDVLIIGVVNSDADYNGFRQVLFVIIGALLVLSGAITFAWPSRGSVESKEKENE